MSEELEKADNADAVVYTPLDPEDGIILEWWGRAEGIDDERQ
jgi:hypothetical protein